MGAGKLCLLFLTCTFHTPMITITITNRAGKGRFGLAWFGLVWLGLAWIDLVCEGLFVYIRYIP